MWIFKEVKEKGQELISDILEKPKFYKDVEKLISEIDAVSKNSDLKNDEKSKDAIAAAKELQEKLETAKKAFDKATKKVHSLTGGGMTAIAYNNEFAAFAKASVDAIHEYQPTIMAAPGVWNQIKAFINNVFEEYLQIKDALGKVEDSKVATTGEFKGRFEEVKTEGKDKMEEIEKDPRGPDIK